MQSKNFLAKKQLGLKWAKSCLKTVANNLPVENQEKIINLKEFIFRKLCNNSTSGGCKDSKYALDLLTAVEQLNQCSPKEQHSTGIYCGKFSMVLQQVPPALCSCEHNHTHCNKPVSQQSAICLKPRLQSFPFSDKEVIDQKYTQQSNILYDERTRYTYSLWGGVITRQGALLWQEDIIYSHSPSGNVITMRCLTLFYSEHIFAPCHDMLSVPDVRLSYGDYFVVYSRNDQVLAIESAPVGTPSGSTQVTINCFVPSYTNSRKLPISQQLDIGTQPITISRSSTQLSIAWYDARNPVTNGLHSSNPPTSVLVGTPCDSTPVEKEIAGKLSGPTQVAAIQAPSGLPHTSSPRTCSGRKGKSGQAEQQSSNGSSSSSQCSPPNHHQSNSSSSLNGSSDGGSSDGGRDDDNNDKNERKKPPHSIVPCSKEHQKLKHQLLKRCLKLKRKIQQFYKQFPELRKKKSSRLVVPDSKEYKWLKRKLLRKHLKFMGRVQW